MGIPVGHYEGDTLVIDTVGIKVGPFAMLDMYGTPHTEALHVVERYRLLDYESANESEDRGEKRKFSPSGLRHGSRAQPGLQGPGTAARVYSRGPGRVHNPLVSQDYLSAPAGQLAGIRLR